MTGWREKLHDLDRFRRFGGLVASLFRNGDNKEIARALKRGNLEEAAEKANMPEEEFAQRMKEIKEIGEALAEDSEVTDALDEYGQERCETANS